MLGDFFFGATVEYCFRGNKQVYCLKGGEVPQKSWAGIKIQSLDDINLLSINTSSDPDFYCSGSTIHIVGEQIESFSIEAQASVKPSHLPNNFKSLYVCPDHGRVSVGINADKTGYSLSDGQAVNISGIEWINPKEVIGGLCGDALTNYGGLTPKDLPKNFESFAIDESGRTVVGLNEDKLNYFISDNQCVNVSGICGKSPVPQISQACNISLIEYDALVLSDLPENFQSLAISQSGEVSVYKNNDKDGYSLENNQSVYVSGISGYGPDEIIGRACKDSIDAALVQYGGLTNNDLPFNFRALKIDENGRLWLNEDQGGVKIGLVKSGVSVSVNNDKRGYSVAQVLDKSNYSLSENQCVNISGIIGEDPIRQIELSCDKSLKKYNAIVPEDLPENFSAFSITSDGRVFVEKNFDKSSYELKNNQNVSISGIMGVRPEQLVYDISRQTILDCDIVDRSDLPYAFCDLIIDSGRVVVGQNDDKLGYSLGGDQSHVTIGLTCDVGPKVEQKINTALLDILTKTKFKEPSNVPPASATIPEMVCWVYTLSRNKIIQTNTEQILRNDFDNGTIGIAQVTHNDNFVRNAWK